MPKPYFVSDDQQIAEFIRVNHAGEFGAQQIYHGQLRYIKGTDNQRLIKNMLLQEQKHLEFFARQIAGQRYRPTLLLPIWRIGGLALGALSSLIGVKTAMLVTQAVEEVIVEHYQEQIDYLTTKSEQQQLLNKIREFQQDELEHCHTAIEQDSSKAYFAQNLSLIIKHICKAAIALSKKI